MHFEGNRLLSLGTTWVPDGSHVRLLMQLTRGNMTHFVACCDNPLAISTDPRLVERRIASRVSVTDQRVATLSHPLDGAYAREHSRGVRKRRPKAGIVFRWESRGAFSWMRAR